MDKNISMLGKENPGEIAQPGRASVLGTEYGDSNSPLPTTLGG